MGYRLEDPSCWNRVPVMGHIVAILLLVFLATSTDHKRSVCEGTRPTCHITHLTERSIIEHCLTESNLVEGQQDAASLGTRCNIRCEAGAATSYCECGEGGFWVGLVRFYLPHHIVRWIPASRDTKEEKTIIFQFKKQLKTFLFST